MALSHIPSIVEMAACVQSLWRIQWPQLAAGVQYSVDWGYLSSTTHILPAGHSDCWLDKEWWKEILNVLFHQASVVREVGHRSIRNLASVAAILSKIWHRRILLGSIQKVVVCLLQQNETNYYLKCLGSYLLQMKVDFTITCCMPCNSISLIMI